jgi:hypothetical protein
MEIRMAKEGPSIVGAAEVLARMQRQLPAQQAEWVRELSRNPGAFADLERSVHNAFQQLADEMVAGLLGEATKPDAWTQDAKKK